MAESKSANRNRGPLLTFFLILWIIGALLGTFHYFFQPSMVLNSQPDLPPWGTPLLGLACLVELVGYLVIWSMRKWGVYLPLIGATYCFIFKMIFFDGQPSLWIPGLMSFSANWDALSMGLGTLLFLLWLAIFGWVVRSRWKDLR
jgi:hypothetical protein